MAWIFLTKIFWREDVKRSAYAAVSTDPDAEEKSLEGLTSQTARESRPSHYSVLDYLVALSAIFCILASIVTLTGRWHHISDAECDRQLRTYSKLLFRMLSDLVRRQLIIRRQQPPYRMRLNTTGSNLVMAQCPLPTRVNQRQRLRRPGPTCGTVSCLSVTKIIFLVLMGCFIDGAFNVPLDELVSLNKSSLDGDFRNVGVEHGGGIAGLLEGFHQIHCLVNIELVPCFTPNQICV